MEISSAKIVDGVIEKIELDGKAEKNDEKTELKEYFAAEVIAATSKKVEIELEDGSKITIYPAEEYKIIDSDTAEEIRLKKLEEGDKILVVGEYDGEDYYASVIIRY
jgi:intein/homing endonuclease